MLSVSTTCPFCACGCGLYLLAEPRELAGVAPSETHPVSSGRLCARGWGAHEAALWGNRFKKPLINKHGTLEPTSWEDALDCVARRMTDLIKAGKPVGVLGSARATNEENYLVCKLARAGLHTNNVDSCFNRLCAPLLAGLEDVCGEDVPSARIDDIERSQTILLTEGDLARTHPRAASSVLKAVEGGARLITLGYLGTQMARIASLHLETAPGNEGEVIDRLLAAVLNLRLEDPTWVAQHCNGLDDLRRAIGSTCLTDEASQAAEWLARAERAVILMAPPIGHPNQARRDAAALATLAALTGHLGKPGSGLLPLLPRSNARGACDMGVTQGYLPGHQPICDPCAQQRLSDLWGQQLPSADGLDAESLLQSVSGLIVLADDPPSVLPIGQRAMAALAKIEFLAVLDSFDTSTSRMADAVLPIACFAETEGTITNMEGRVQEVHAATDPPAEARPGWQVLAGLCARFGVGGSYNSGGDVLNEIGLAAPLYARREQGMPDKVWGGQALQGFNGRKYTLRAAGVASLPTDDRPTLLVRDEVFDWGSDPLISYSPTLSRDSQSQRKLFPKGFVEIGKPYADQLGIPVGRQVRLTSATGQAVLPLRLRPGLKSGVLVVPFAFRDHVAQVLGADGVTAVRLEQA